MAADSLSCDGNQISMNIRTCTHGSCLNRAASGEFDFETFCQSDDLGRAGICPLTNVTRTRPFCPVSTTCSSEQLHCLFALCRFEFEF